MYPLTKVRYTKDEKFPFELLCDVPRTVKKSLEALNMSQIQDVSPTDYNNLPDENPGTVTGKSVTPAADGYQANE